jgi:hypothetical protein
MDKEHPQSIPCHKAPKNWKQDYKGHIHTLSRPPLKSSKRFNTFPKTDSNQLFKPQIPKLLLNKAKVHDLYMYMNALKLSDELTPMFKLYLLYPEGKILESSPVLTLITELDKFDTMEELDKLSLFIGKISDSSSPNQSLLKEIIILFITLIKDIKYGKFPKEHSSNISCRSKLQQSILNSISDSLTLFLKCPNLPLGETLLIMKIKLLLSFTNRVKKDQITSQYRLYLFYEKFEEELKGYIDKLEILHELPEVVTFLRKISMIFMSYLAFKSASRIVGLNK